MWLYLCDFVVTGLNMVKTQIARMLLGKLLFWQLAEHGHFLGKDLETEIVVIYVVMWLYTWLCKYNRDIKMLKISDIFFYKYWFRL